MRASELAMLQTWRKPAKLYSDFNTLQFACVMSLVVFVLLVFFMTAPTRHRSVSTDLAKADHPVAMPWADREDALKVTITRDAIVFFRNERIDPVDLAQKIGDHLKDRTVERKVYIAADTQARWSNVKPVLDAVHQAGIVRVAFLVDQRRSAALHMKLAESGL